MSHDFPGQFDENLNPYAAPQARVEHWDVRGREGTSRLEFEVGDVFSRAWAIYKPQMGLCIGVVIGGIAIGAVPQILLQGVLAVMQAARVQPILMVPVLVLGALGLVLLQFWLQCGMLVFMLNLTKGRKATFNDLFAGGPYLLRIFLAGILLFLLIAALVALCFIPLGLAAALAGGPDARSTVFPAAIGISLLATMIVVIVASIRFSQYTYLIIDQGAGAMEALQQSLELTRGKGLRLLGLFFLTGLIYIAGAFACYIGLIFTGPYALVVLSVTYLAMTGQPVADPNASWQADLPELKPLIPEDPLS